MFDFMVKLLPFLMSAMGIAEKCLGPKTGKEKKKLVMEGARVVTGSFENLSTGGQRATWERISDPVSKIVDGACTILFKTGQDREGNDEPNYS